MLRRVKKSSNDVLTGTLTFANHETRLRLTGSDCCRLKACYICKEIISLGEDVHFTEM